MELLNVDISTLSYKEIKAQLEDVSAIEEAQIQQLIGVLLSDKRKNVNSLGTKIIKDREKLQKEIERVKAMYDFDRAFGCTYVAGVDEVGRGPLAGPIVACAVILDLNVKDEDMILGLNDSKKLSEHKRNELAEIIKDKAIAYKISLVSNEDIDKKGIAFANNYVFLESCNSLEKKPELVLSDGYLVKNIKIDNKSVIKGDTKSANIAAASIVAKVYRDELMKKYAEKYPEYNFEDNVGYGTGKHVDAIKKYGPCEIHRKSFLTKILE